MRETKSAHLAGTTGAYVVMHYTVPLADPDGLGNQGLTGFDEADDEATAPDAAAARLLGEAMYAAHRNAHPDQSVEWLRVTTFRYDQVVIEDDEYGTILDAEEVIVSEQFSYMDDHGAPVWAQEELRRH
jgi:hypothetical protein